MPCRCAAVTAAIATMIDARLSVTECPRHAVMPLITPLSSIDFHADKIFARLFHTTSRRRLMLRCLCRLLRHITIFHAAAVFFDTLPITPRFADKAPFFFFFFMRHAHAMPAFSRHIATLRCAHT